MNNKVLSAQGCLTWTVIIVIHKSNHGKILMTKDNFKFQSKKSKGLINNKLIRTFFMKRVL